MLSWSDDAGREYYVQYENWQKTSGAIIYYVIYAIVLYKYNSTKYTKNINYNILWNNGYNAKYFNR